jgi:hypothetical protein
MAMMILKRLGLYVIESTICLGLSYLAYNVNGIGDTKFFLGGLAGQIIPILIPCNSSFSKMRLPRRYSPRNDICRAMEQRKMILSRNSCFIPM